MEVALVASVVGAVVTNLVAKLSTVISERFSEIGALDIDIRYLRSQLDIIDRKIKKQKGTSSVLPEVSTVEMRDLAFDIEDCLDKFLPCASCGGGAVPIGNSVDFARQVGKLKKRMEIRSKQSAEDKDDVADVAEVAEDFQWAFNPENQVGIEKPKKEILGLLDCEKLMVIPIVGFGGSGKTTLARAVFNCVDAKKFGLRAWYAASEYKKGEELLVAIVKYLQPEETLTAAQILHEVKRLQDSIRVRLQNTRCLIVIDDIETGHWDAIGGFFSELKMIRIVLTTTMKTVANGCSRDSDYIHDMRTLSKQDSKDLLKKVVVRFNANSPDLANGSDEIVRKCHGHPLALISVANYLCKCNEDITGTICQTTSSQLCTHVDNNTHKAFTKLRQVLINNYISLPANLKTCLLYTSLFPNDRPVSRKTVIGRWLAEGYIMAEVERTEQQAADHKFDQLIDRNIIRPIDTSNSGIKKTFKSHGIMHQFMLYKSKSANFVASSLENRHNFRHLIMDNRTKKCSSDMDHGTSPAVRRPNGLKRFLRSCFKPSTSTEVAENPDKGLRPRSLTVFGSAEEDVYSDLIKCKLLRVLDLKECDNLDDEHIKNIYQLLHVKYLTLGCSVSNLPDGMEKLHCLETLDLRKTKIDTLPLEVIRLPHLAHLFGKIRLEEVDGDNRKKYKLQTLSGVVVDSNSGFPELMLHMEQLKKVKIWCKISANDRNYAILSKAIQKFAQAGTNTGEATRSLSLHLNDPSKGLPRHLEGDNPDTPLLFCLMSLKVHGSLSQFHEFATFLAGIKELCLTYTKLKGPDLLAGLRKLEQLVYLKLVEVDLTDLDIDAVGDLPSLQRLCLVVEQSRFPRIAQGALQNLVSLQLLCKDLVGLCGGIKLEHFKDLREVALDSRVHKINTIEKWEDEAKNHAKMPKVVLLKRVEPASPVKYVATDDGFSEALVQGTT